MFFLQRGLLNACSELFGVLGPSAPRRAAEWMFAGGRTAKSFSQVAGERCHMLTRRGPDSLSRRAAALTGGLFFKGGRQG